MAIARDIHGNDGNTTDSGKTTSITLGGTANILIVGSFSGVNDPSAPPTWNGVSMGAAVVTNSNVDTDELHIYFMANPATGTHNLVTSFPASTNNTTFWASYSGASTATPTSTAIFYADPLGGSTMSVTTLSTTGSAWYFAICFDGGSMTAGTNATQLDTANPTFQASYDSNGIAGSSTMSFNVGAGGRGGIAALAFQTAATANKSNFFAFM